MCYLAVYTRVFAARYFISRFGKKTQPARRRLEIGYRRRLHTGFQVKSLRMQRVFSDQGVVSHKSFSTILNPAIAPHKP